MEQVSKMKSENFNRLSLSEQVESALRREITEGHIAPGERVDVSGYKKGWNISSTPFRDALRALENQGFVTIEPRKGVFVAPMNIGTLREIFDVRIALECMAVELATRRMPIGGIEELVGNYRAAIAGENDDFDIEKEDRVVHDMARDYCGNARIERLLLEQMDLFSWAHHTIVAELPHSFSLALPEHLGIAESYLSQDVGRSVEAMRCHLESSRDRLIALRESLPQKSSIK